MDFLLTETGNGAVDMMRTIQRALDPLNIMNPGRQASAHTRRGRQIGGIVVACMGCHRKMPMNRGAHPAPASGSRPPYLAHCLSCWITFAPPVH